MTRFLRKIDFSSLGLTDLIEARDAYHVHLANIDNVVGTAIGRFLIRRGDPNEKDPAYDKKSGPGEERTLGNSVIKPWSWPAVLVFIDQWVNTNEFAKRPDQYVPPRLYLPDGRVVPTCVVKAESRPSTERPIAAPVFSETLMAPGDAIGTDSQGERRIGTVGCLVTDGADMYALTSGHVLGATDDEVITMRDGERIVVGYVSGRAQQRVDFEKAYPGWKITRGLLNADAGLVRLKSTADWDAIPTTGKRLGDIVNLSVDTLTLDLIGCPVRGLWAASTGMHGQISALFYRYRSVGGFDYVADFLIGPRGQDDPVVTQPGDSGAIWCWDAPEDTAIEERERVPAANYEPRPIALQWGGHSFLERGGQGRLQIALASSISTILRLLDVELVRDLTFERDSYWGKTGHYKVAQIACGLTSAAGSEIDQLLLKNQNNISISDANLKQGKVPADGQTAFIALADIPDLWWRAHRGKDKANHFADLDEPGLNLTQANGPQQTLLQQWANHATRTTAMWDRFYVDKNTTLEHRGALPFRVWQAFDLLVKAAKAGDVSSFIFVAGTVAHYIGDACQPLHVSRLHHGHDASEDGVHSDYETTMMDRNVGKLVDGVNALLQQQNQRVKAADLYATGADAADHMVKLMKHVIEDILKPEDVITSWKNAHGASKYTTMWNDLGDRTCQCIVAGARAMALFWESAWHEGRKNLPPLTPAAIRAVSRTTLLQKYNDPAQFESNWIKDMHLP